MALPRLSGNGPGRLFPRLLLGLSAQMNLDVEIAENQLLNGNLSFLVERI